MDRLISLEPSNIVPIRIETGHKCSGNLTLRNVMYTLPVAFKLQPNEQACYTITPHSGIIPPLATLTLEIIYHLPLGMILPYSYPRCNDSFLLYSVVTPGAAVKDPYSTYDAVPNDWFTAKKKQVFIDSSVKVMFVGPSVLARVIADGSMDEIREVLERSDPAWKASDSVDTYGQTLLHLAIAQGRPDIVQLLLEFEPNVEATSRSGSTPLEAAVVSGEALIVELLLAHHASTGRSETSHWGPIHHASGNGHKEILRLLLLKGANVDALTKDGTTALHIATEAQRRECLRLLLSNGANTDVRCFSDGDTPLHVAAALGDEHVVNLLLQHGANKDIRNRFGKIAYDIAAENGDTGLFEVLRLGDSYCKAARKGELRLIHNLLDHGVSINARDQHGWTALHRASFKGKIDVVRSLVEKGIDIDAKDEDGYTALHCAVESGNLDITELLIKKGANIDARTKKNLSALQIAESMAYEGIKRILILGDASQDGMLKFTYSFVNRIIAKQESEAEGLKKRNRRKDLRINFHQYHTLAVN